MKEGIQPKGLEDLFNGLIAEKDGIQKSEVTVEYIKKQREKKFYPTTRYNIGTDYGGYDHTGLKFMTRQEIDNLIKREETEK